MLLAFFATASISASLARAGPGWQCNGPDYIALPATDKLDRIWENCADDQTSANWLGMLEIGEIMFEDMCPTFNTEGDQMPLGWTGNVRQKYIHTVGTVGKVEWVDMGGHPYTGIFKGATKGIARLSLAQEPSPPALSTAPGMGLKFLRDGVDSANLVAMFDVAGQESWNFFKNVFTAHIPEVSGPLVFLGAKFYTATNNIRQVRLSHPALLPGWCEQLGKVWRGWERSCEPSVPLSAAVPGFPNLKAHHLLSVCSPQARLNSLTSM